MLLHLVGIALAIAHSVPTERSVLKYEVPFEALSVPASGLAAATEPTLASCSLAHAVMVAPIV